MEHDANRTHLLDPLMLDLCEPLGKLILDVGCGEGRFCRMLSSRGAKSVGLDPVKILIKRACELGSQCAIGDAERLPFLSQTFDTVSSYVALVDVPDFRRAIAEMARVAKRGGSLVVSIVHPMTSTIPYWEKDASGNKLFRRLDHYFDEIGERVAWSGIDVCNWHRPLEAYVQAFLECGLILDRFIEPRPSEQQVAERPAIAEHLRVPNFLAMRWCKQ